MNKKNIATSTGPFLTSVSQERYCLLHPANLLLFVSHLRRYGGMTVDDRLTAERNNDIVTG